MKENISRSSIFRSKYFYAPRRTVLPYNPYEKSKFKDMGENKKISANTKIDKDIEK